MSRKSQIFAQFLFDVGKRSLLDVAVLDGEYYFSPMLS